MLDLSHVTKITRRQFLFVHSDPLITLQSDLACLGKQNTKILFLILPTHHIGFF